MRVRVRGLRETARRLTQGLFAWHAQGQVTLPGGVVVEVPDDIQLDCQTVGLDQRLTFVGQQKPRVIKTLAGFRFAGPITTLDFRPDGAALVVGLAGLPDVTIEFLEE